MNGYVMVRITGKNIRYFINNYLIRKNINYSNYKYINFKQAKLTINYDDYLKLIDKNNSTYEIEALKFYGLCFYINYFKNNFFFIISIIISLVLLYVINSMCFNIKVIHNDKEIRNLIYDELKYYNVVKYRFMPSYNRRKKIISDIIKNNKNKIEWLEIDRSGNKLIIKVTERKINKKDEVLKNRHIVAKKSGIIMKIEASSGMIMKKNNDYVSKGEIIVSGDIIKDETIKGQVAAKGRVFAEVWYKVNVSYPLYYKQITYLDEIKNNFILSYFDSSLSLKKNYVNSYLENKFTLIKDKIFPFSIRVEKQRKTKIKKENLSAKEATLKSLDIATRKIASKLSNDEYIIDKKVIFSEEDKDKINVQVFFKVCEDITDYEDSVEAPIIEDDNK